MNNQDWINKLIDDSLADDNAEQIDNLNQVLRQRRVIENEKMHLIKRMALMLGIPLSDYGNLFPSKPSSE